LPKLKTVSIDGPYNVFGMSEGASRRLLYVCHPGSGSGATAAKSAAGGNLDETACATKILTNLAHRAFRRPVTPADIEAPMAFYKKSRQSGKVGGVDVGGG